MFKSPTESPSIPEPLLSRFDRYLSNRIGLRFPRERWHVLEQGIGNVARELGFEDPESCIAALMASPLTQSRIEILASHLTVGETYFFREKNLFALLEQELLPALIKVRRETQRQLRVWSAACSTGEEAYSIAILLSRLIPDINNWNITILGTDINPHFLRKASTGIYRDWSFRDTPHWVKNYFKKAQSGGFEILPSVKALVSWSFLNLADGIYPARFNGSAAFDIVFCRNVLMYFAPEQVKNVVDNLHRALVDSGYLVVSPSEASKERFAQFTQCNFSQAILYQKNSLIRQEISVPRDKQLGRRPSARPYVIAKTEGRSAVIAKTQQMTKLSQSSTNDKVRALLAQCHYDEAIERLLAMLKANPDVVETDVAETMSLLARAYAGQSRLTDALAWCQQAVAADKLNAAYRYLLATILQELNRIEEAINALRQALYLCPEFALAHFALGNLMLRQDNRQNAKRHFGNALALLEALPPQDSVPEADGMTAGSLIAIIRRLL